MPSSLLSLFNTITLARSFGRAINSQDSSCFRFSILTWVTYLHYFCDFPHCSQTAIIPQSFNRLWKLFHKKIGKDKASAPNPLAMKFKTKLVLGTLGILISLVDSQCKSRLSSVPAMLLTDLHSLRHQIS